MRPGKRERTYKKARKAAMAAARARCCAQASDVAISTIWDTEGLPSGKGSVQWGLGDRRVHKPSTVRTVDVAKGDG